MRRQDSDRPYRPEGSTETHIDILDGWRALSIICVLLGHWLPLGPSYWEFNAAIATTGMAIFFTLSGFLIVGGLLRDPRVPQFLIRRLFRILPLAWAAMLILFLVYRPSGVTMAWNLLLAANLPNDRLIKGGEHLWSLCVEAQFYAAVAILVAVAGKRSLTVIPIAAVAVTMLRIAAGQTISIVTWHRVDEILAGGTLALCVYRTNMPVYLARLPAWLPLALLVLLIASGDPWTGSLAYFRPYLAAAAVGVSIYSAPIAMRRLFCSTSARYIAQISYAVYVIHGVLAVTWLGSGSKGVKYVKRPFLALATFILAHFSTFRYESAMINVGKRITRRLNKQNPNPPPA